MEDMNRIDRSVRDQAFRLLLLKAAPVSVDDLAIATREATDVICQALARLRAAGLLRVDEVGEVTGSCGLSVTPDRHEIEVKGRRFWTWCAYDVLGIFGALGATGAAHSVSPADGSTIEVRFEKGQPQSVQAVLFRPDASLAACCENVYEEWCPNSNLFANKAAALKWAAEHRVSGQVLSLAEATKQGAAEWRSVTADLEP